MADESDTLTYERAVAATPAEVYRAFTSSTALREWLCDTATTSPRPNGHLFVGWNDGYYATGHFTELLPNRTVCFTWQGRGEPQPTRVHVAIEPRDQGATIRLEHSGIGHGPEWGDKTAEFDRAWRRSLENLNSVLTSGEDLRITRRPMLGILLAAFDAAAAARLGVPMAEGVRLSGVVPRLGAAAAGLGQDDVIVSIDDRPTPNVAALRGALQSRQVGDIVTVAFYRGGARHELPMVLSGRAIPTIPAGAPELLARVTERYARDEVALDAALDGVSDLEASFRPGPEEWNVKQVVAHLIQGERYNQQWISELLGDLEASYDSDAANQGSRTCSSISCSTTCLSSSVPMAGAVSSSTSPSSLRRRQATPSATF